MNLDVSTLTLAGGLVSLASGLFLLISWWQDRSAWAALWWGAASCGMGIGICLLALEAVVPAYLSRAVGPLLLDLGAVLTWVAARLFNRGSIRAYPVIAGIGGGFVLLVAVGRTDPQLAAATGAALSGCLYVVASMEFWWGRHEVLRGRWAMILLLGFEAAAVFLAALDLSSAILPTAAPMIGWLGIIHFVGLLYAVGSAISLVTMLKERTEAKHKAAALVDPLTGLANRRAFMSQAERLFARERNEDGSVSLLAFDLDRFKTINDSFGHPIGDQVLRIFADVMVKSLRPNDAFGRVGGEEFSAVLPGCDLRAAVAMAERIRVAFQGEARFVNGNSVGATVSIGIAKAANLSSTLAEVTALADAALYSAKSLGRNRIVTDVDVFSSDVANVIRIA